jgi:sulfane dehydrogenase subunit SoxC
MAPRRNDRRRFLKDAAALAGAAVVTGSAASGQSTRKSEKEMPTPGPPYVVPPYGERSRFVTSIRRGEFAPLQDFAGIITPSALHYTVDHGSPIPDIDPQQHRLMIHGMVDRPLIFTVDEVKRFPSVSRIHFLQCAGSSYLPLGDRENAETVQQTHGKTSCSEWTGVPLSTLLKEAGVKNTGTWIVAEGAEWKKHTISIPMEKAMDDALVVYAQNGEPVRREQGFPLRLLVPGWEGVRNVKYLRRIKVVDQPYMTKWESTVYTNLRPDGKARWFQFELEPCSVITFPSGGQKLPMPGFYEITGLAWSGAGSIRRVEVSTDKGKTWKDAHLQEPVLRKAHTRFRFPWEWDGKEAVLLSRCTDEYGAVQPTKAEVEKLWGVKPDYWLSTTNRIQHFNACQPWKVSPEGSVHNAIWEI